MKGPHISMLFARIGLAWLLILNVGYSFRYLQKPIYSRQGTTRNSHRELTSEEITSQKPIIPLYPCGDVLDRKILNLAIPAILNLMIIPLLGAVDMYFIGKMNNALAIAGSAAANQVFASTFWIFSFLPLVITPLVAAASASGDNNAVQSRITEALLIGTVIGVVGTALLGLAPAKMLSIVLPTAAASRVYAEPYLKYRALTFGPALLSTVGFAAFRGKMDVVTPLKISLFSNIINAILDPIFIFNFNMGVSGAAAATCVSELISFLIYMQQMIKLKMIKLSLSLPDLSTITPFIFGGLSVQLRAICIEVAFISVTRATQLRDPTGVTAAAHAISLQIWGMASIVLFAMNGVSSIMIPSEVARSGSYITAKPMADRLFMWGLLLGGLLGLGQLSALPVISVFSSLPAVQEAAKGPTVIAGLLQFINGIVFIGEGIQQGDQDFLTLAKTTLLATASMLLALKFIGNTSLLGIWACLGVFYVARLGGVLSYYFITGPFSKIRRGSHESGIDGTWSLISILKKGREK